MSERLNLQDLVDLLAKEQGVTKKDAELFLKELFLLITENIENLEPVRIKDFGTLKPIRVNARKSVNVNTGEEFEIPSHYKLGFTPDKTLRDLVNKPFAHFESVILEDGVSFDNIEEDLSESLDDTNDSEESDITPDQPEENNAISEQDIEEHIAIVTDNNENEKITIESIIQDHEIVEIDQIIEEDLNNTEHTGTTPTIDNKDEDKKSEERVIDVLSGEEDEEQTSDTLQNIINSDTTNYKSDYKKMGSNTKKTIIIGVIILIGALGAWIYSGYFEEFMVKRGFWYKVVKAPKADIPDSTPISDFDGESQNQQLEPDSVFLNTTIADKESETTAKENNTTNETALAATDSPNTPETKISIEAGNTLRTLGLKYFGNKSFWVYIYQENKEKIKNPNNVPIGTQLIIPPSSKYDINAKDPKSVEKAKQLEQQIYKQFGL